MDLGAPYVERNGTPGYQKPPAFSETFKAENLITGKYDEPGVAGADPNSPAGQVIWTVFNDQDDAVSRAFAGSEPTGIESQVTLWGYKRSDALGSIYFKRIRLINKGTSATTKYYIDSMYVAQWSDPDNGDSGDDLCGCDTTTDVAGRKSLAYVYNGNAVDIEFAKFGLPAPAIGYEFLGGPLVAAPGDSGVFDLKRVYNKKNLGMSSFSWFAAGSAISDPAFTYEGGLRWWKMLNGYVPDASTAPWTLYPAPPGSVPTKYPLSGDPVTRKGSVDGLGTTYSFSPGDRRINATTGPFRFAPGDTQEVVVGTVAGIGSDRLSGISVMKFNDRFVRFTYKAVFAVPSAPARPKVNVAELDREVILEWGSDEAAMKATEQTVQQPGQYEFEGYNVYQFPSVSSSLGDATRIVTFDLETDPTVVLDEGFDESSGMILQKPVQFGSNSGISRKFSLTKDYVKDIPVLYNGYSYYVAVTAYSVSKIGFLPTALESAPEIRTVVPQTPPPGTRYGGAAGDTVKGITQILGTGGTSSDGSVIPIIVNPAALTGHKYRVSFNDVTDTVAHTTTTYWSVTDVNLNKVLLKDQANQTGDDNYIVVDGMQLKVTGPPPGMKSWSIPSGTRRFSPVGGFTGLGLEGFSNAGDPTAYDQETGTIGMAGHLAFGGIGTTLKVNQYRNVLLKMAVVNNTALWDPRATPTDTNYSRAYRYLRSAGAPAKPEFATWITNVAAGYPYQGYDWSAPFSAWNMETNPPTRLAVGHFENNVAAGLVDGRYWPPLTDVANSGPREFAFIFLSPYTTTPDPALAVNISNNATTPLMWVMVCNRRAEAAWVAGDQFMINANHVNTPANTFEFTAPANTMADPTLAKEDVGRISVYPNPYYAWNPAGNQPAGQVRHLHETSRVGDDPDLQPGRTAGTRTRKERQDPVLDLGLEQHRRLPRCQRHVYHPCRYADDRCHQSTQTGRHSRAGSPECVLTGSGFPGKFISIDAQKERSV